MTTIILGALVLSLIHPAIPNHWLPLVVIGRTEKWGRGETAAVTAIAAFAHIASTILVGVFVGLVGFRLYQAHSELMRLAAPAILAILGVAYIISDIVGRGEHHHHYQDSPEELGVKKGRAKGAIIASLTAMMFFSPCIEIEAFFFTAAAYGWAGIVAVMLIYTVLCVLGMIVLVQIGMVGLERLRWHFLEHHERLITGAVLAGLGVFTYFVEI